MKKFLRILDISLGIAVLLELLGLLLAILINEYLAPISNPFNEGLTFNIFIGVILAYIVARIAYVSETPKLERSNTNRIVASFAGLGVLILFIAVLSLLMGIGASI